MKQTNENEVTVPLVPEWYILVVDKGYEFKVHNAILALSKTPMYQNIIFDVKLQTKDEENKKGKIVTKIDAYTRYVFVKMVYDPNNDIGYHGVKVEGVRHILGAPTPLKDDEVEDLGLEKGTDE